MKWKIAYFNDQLQEEIFNLPDGPLARYIKLTERMETYGSNLGSPHTLPFGEGLFELRLKGKEGIARVFFCTIIGKKIYMLHCFVKKTQKTPPKEIEIAKNRMYEVKNND